MRELPLTSVIMPCFNEEDFIAQSLDSIISNDYPKDKLEVLVIDGMSTDETRKVVKDYTLQYTFIKLLNNPKKRPPCAMNVGIRRAKGDIILRMDAHTIYPEEYISKCVRYLEQYDVDNVGGVLRTRPRNETALGKAIAIILSHSFGVGKSYFRIGSKEPKYVDTVAFGCYKKETFEKVGLYDEDIRNEDVDLNLRLKATGGKILLHPDIHATYYTKSNLISFCRYSFRKGLWLLHPSKLYIVMSSFRRLVPFVFVLSLIISAILSSFSLIFLWAFFLIFSSYTMINLYFSAKIAFDHGNIGYIFLLPLIFTLFHSCFGIGSFWGLCKAMISKPFWELSPF